MVKISKKRKKEGDLLSGKNKLQRVTKTRNQSDDSPNDNDSEKLLVSQENTSKRVKNKQQRSQNSKSVQRFIAEEGEDDESRTESQSFLDMLAEQSKNNRQAAKAAKDFFEAFGQTIDLTAEKLKNHIRDHTQQAARQDAEFLSSFKTAYALSRPSCPPENTDEGFTFASLYSRTQELIVRAQSAITYFEIADREIKNKDPQSLLANIRWEEQILEVNELLKLGHQIGIKKYNSMVKGRTEEQDINNLDHVEIERIYSPEEANEGVSWGILARKQMKALKKAFKAANYESTVPQSIR
ncbi:hypothetical protein K3495_g4865 [Podosphaera aphanis]|nr:hypothetical protein K3495_g4865 [Podosphaera aphanis]